MKKNVLAVIVLGLAVAARLAAASGGAETVRLSLDQAIVLGLKNSSSIQAKVNSLAAAKVKLAGARSAYFPTLSVGLSWTHLFEQPEIPAGGYAAASDPIGLSVDVGQTLFTFGRISGGVKLAQEAVEQAVLDLEDERRKLVVLIKRAFYGYLLALEVEKINHETFAGKEESYATAKERYEAGLISEFEVLNAESDRESFRATVISSQNGVRIALLNAKNALGVEGDDFKLELVGALEPIPVSPDREALIARAAAVKYDVRSLRKTLQIIELQNKLARSANKPTLVAWLNYRLSSGFNSESGENEYFVGDSWDHNLTAGVNLSVPVSALFPWSKETADIRSSRIDLANMRINLNSLLSGIKLAVETTILKIAEEEAKIDSGRKSISLAERLYESALEQFDSGYISSKDLKDSQLGLNASRLALAQAIFSYNMNVLDLMDAVGVTGLGDNR